MRSPTRLGWVVGAALAVTGSAGASSPPVSISLETSWPAPPFILEILETVYDESPSSYFPLLHLLSSLPESCTPSTILSSTLDLISSYSLLPSPSSLSTFHLALSLQSTAPRIEAEYSWYESVIRSQETKLGVAGCEGWVEWRGKGFCDVEELRRDMELSIEENDHLPNVQPLSQPFDHTFPSSSSSTPTSPRAIIYYTPSSAPASSLLNYLAHHASIYPDFTYTVRYQPPSNRSAEGVRKTPLAGWGVEMVLKKTDYLVVDDRASAGSTSGVEQGVTSTVGLGNETETGVFSQVLGEDPWSDLANPLTTEEVKDLGLKATALIMASDDPLEALTHLSQDFPKYSAALARSVEVPENIRIQSRTIAVRGQGGPAIYVNGKALGSDLNAYSLLKAIRDERHLILSLTSLGLTPKQAVNLISDPVVGQAQTEDEAGEGIVDASDRIEGDKVITWWNDIEKDKRYKNWPVHIQGYMRPIYPGQFHTVRRNTWNLVFVLDLASVPSLDIIASSISPMIQRGLPIRFGIVPMFDLAVNDISSQMAKIFHYSVQTFGRGATRDFFAALVGIIPSTLTAPGTVTIDHARKAYDILAAESTKAALPFDEVIASEDYDHHLAQTAEYMNRLLATKQESKAGHLFINGKYTPLGGHWTAIVQSEMASQLGYLQEQIMLGDAPEDMSTYFYDLPSSSKRRSKLVIPGTGETKLRSYNLIDLFQDDAAKKLTSDFVYADGDRGAPITMWVVGDLDTAEGQRVVMDALRHLDTPECASRLGFIHIASTDHQEVRGNERLSTMIYQLLDQSSLSTARPSDLLDLFGEVDLTSEMSGSQDEITTQSSEDPQRSHESQPLNGMTFDGWTTSTVAASAEFWKVGSKIADELGLEDGRPHLLVNGRLVGPLTEKTFPVEDFDALEIYEHRKRVKPVIDVLKTMYDDITVFDRPTLGNLIAMSSSVITAAYKPVDAEGIFAPLQMSRGRFYRKLDNGDMSFTIGDLDTAILQVAAVVDPLSEHAQRWSTQLKTLAEMENIAVSVYLEPEPVMTEVKLKRFYRASIPPQVTFDVDGEVIAPGVVFDNLPSSPIFTLGLDTPPSWIVSPKTSPYDLDNLVLSQVHDPLHVLFQLKQLLIEGHAREGENVPPRGLQLQLRTGGLEVAADTQVMANLGYLQFRATPGVYELSIRPGRGREVFELESVGNRDWDSETVNVTGAGVMLASFEGTTIFPRIARKDGMERADVLAPEDGVKKEESLAGAVFSKMKSIIGLSTELATTNKSRHADINIFTVASGLLYERFASIMILSVMKHTKSTVKFWFIENFLSPTFIAFIPKLAEEYGFQYELVTYKWPHWLRAQTEKQRIIWAYKILFLDVLFPMDLDKVIFVDADQIVRTDMKELVDVDLHGRVYGYPPMGNSREGMEGFRFWKTGYWKDALRGRPYHISALYVVDLKRFRQDRLRGQYHALSADPNSLANLDQDLPNSMQDTIPIWTLDQDWLWCQTWCSDGSLETAKTIDLCQNPLTKEPKLVRARQIPEWDVYDREIAAFAARVSEDGGESGALAGSVDDLASEVVKGGNEKSLEAIHEDAGSDMDEADEEDPRRLEDEL
ncbi:hypothetical protein IAR55_000508 [Kwoniella newhampshirensis]|uniref:UDP-glucose:glycoprotein glucosyltransferase n=1 Tax=Kwoniella newhampshirensis TaxID=1651941 RepID=A0AAW0Z7D7_9TREE